VINIITRHGLSLQGIELSGEAGTFDTYKGRLSYGKQFDGNAALSLSGSVLDSKGDPSLFFPEFNDPAHNNGIAKNLDYERNYTLFGTASLQDFTLQGAYVSRTKGIPTASFDAAFNDPRFLTVDNRGYLDLKYKHAFADEWTGMARLFYDTYYYHENNPLDGTPPGQILNLDSAQNRWWGTELQVGRRFFEQHQLIAGVDYQQNLLQRFDNHDITPFLSHLNVDRPSWRWATYLQDEITLFPDLILNAGVRYDFYSTFGGTLNPRAALIYTPWDGTALKAIYGEAFRAPNNYELYYDVPDFGQKGNPGLKPEKIRTYELIWEQRLGDHFRSTLGGFYNDITDMIVQETDPSDGLLVFRNSEHVKAKGVETELDGKFQNGLQGRVSYTFQDAHDDSDGEILVDSPQHMAKLNLIVPLYDDRVFSGLELQFLSQRKTLAGNQAGAYLIGNLTLFGHKLFKGLELSGSIYNLFDRKYGDPGSGEHREDIIVQDGRIFRLKLTYTFL
jgi:iron complex outermembrane receptor protein